MPDPYALSIISLIVSATALIVSLIVSFFRNR